MSNPAPSISLLLGVCFSLVLPVVSACDRPTDFSCEASWAQAGKLVSKTTYEYKELKDENEATKRCKEDMMKERPKGADQAKCECKGSRVGF